MIWNPETPNAALARAIESDPARPHEHENPGYLTAAAVTGECLLSVCCSCTAKKVPVQPTSAQAWKNFWNPLVASA